MKTPNFDQTRRGFLKSSAGLTLATWAGVRTPAATLAARRGIALVAIAGDAVAEAAPAVWARDELSAALGRRGAAVRSCGRIEEATSGEFCIIITATNSPAARAVAQGRAIGLPVEAESLCLVSGELARRPVLLAAGSDALGLVYALTELADRAACLDTLDAALDFSRPLIERPASRTRSVLRGFSSEVEDGVWFYDRDFWRNYLTMLVGARVNRFSLALGMAYNSVLGVTDGYLLFPYPFFLAVPGYTVRPHGLSDEERARNLAILKFIGDECARRGLRFQIGIWTLAFEWARTAASTYHIEGLTAPAHPAYCRDALALLLREVPAISGVTFRVHSESGIPPGSHGFWATQFQAIQHCGRRVEIDMHGKSLEPATLASALATGQPVVVSPKFCGEHLGLPYHQASIRTRERTAEGKFTDTGEGVLAGDRRFTRSGYGDYLAENRNWDVVFRIWPGTQRFLLNGDPATFAGYGRTAAFCGAAGFEWSEPLHFKGRRGSGQAGGRCAYVDTTLTPRYDFEKYLYSYRLWGRLGYNPDAEPEIWRRALRREFGAAAAAVENALGSASRVLPLFTLVHGQSTDCGSYWPEIYTNMAIADEELNRSHRDTTPPVLFGNVCPFDPQLFQTPFEYGAALLAGETSGKYTPLEVAEWFEKLAAVAQTQIGAARGLLGATAAAPAFRRVEEDVLIQRGLGLFFAAKLRSAVLWRIHTLTGSRAAGAAAIAAYAAGRDAWAAMAERAQRIYVADISYGSRRGHWIDRIPAFDEDIADLRRRLAAAAEQPVPAGTAEARALQIAQSTTARPGISPRHSPPRTFEAGHPLRIAVQTEPAAWHRAKLHYRRVNQALAWQSVEFTREGDGFWAEIPATYTAGRYPLQYYFEVWTDPTHATFFPTLARDLSNVPYFVVRRGASVGG